MRDKMLRVRGKARQIHAGSAGRIAPSTPKEAAPTAGASLHDRPIPPPVSVPMTTDYGYAAQHKRPKIAGQKTANQNRKRQ